MTGGDGLLYVPDDDLVRSTVEGDDAEWADARSYVPSEALISTVLRGSVRETPRFKFPDWYTSPQPTRPETPIRAASAVFAALHLSPSILAAATALHVVAFLALGPLTIATGHAIDGAPRTPRAVDAPRLIYMVPPPAAPVRAQVRSAPRLTVSSRGFSLANPDSARFAAIRAADSLAYVVDSGARIERGREENELAAALEREFRLGGDPLRIEPADRVRLEEVARILAARPVARLRVIGFGPPGPDGLSGARQGMREAEAFARELMSLGVNRERIELYASEGQSLCPDREPRCQANRSRVRTSLWSSRR